MLIPLSWLKEFVDIKIPLNELAWKMTESGLAIESWKEIEGDFIFDPEVTPNRPDLLSVYGIAREISAVTGAKLMQIPEKYKTTNLKPKGAKMEINFKPNYDLVPRETAIVIRNVKVRPSPEWLQKRIKQIGLRPINNLVDITNYVLWTYGSLLHTFDYDKIRGHQMTVEQAKGGEDFRSLDGISYKLPKEAVVIKDVGRIIDLLPLKGGENTATTSETKNVLVHSVIVDPVLTRRTSHALGLRSDSSAIAEKGLDPNGTLIALNKALEMVLELAGGEVASEIMDHKKSDFKKWTVEMRHERLESILGLKFERVQVLKCLQNLELKPELRGATYLVEIPTFRNDLHLEEDLIEEVARMHGYNNFPKTLPSSPVPTATVAYSKNYDFEYELKQILRGEGYGEIYSYSLVSESQLSKLGLDSNKALRITNPISRDFEFLHPTLLGNLLEGVKINQANFPEVKLFELGKHYLGPTLDRQKEEYHLSAVVTGQDFFQVKGDLEWLMSCLSASVDFIPPAENEPGSVFHPGRVADIKDGKTTIGRIGEIHPATLARFAVKNRVIYWSLSYEYLESHAKRLKSYSPVSKYPPIIEDLSLLFPKEVTYKDVVMAITKTSTLIRSVDLIDSHENSRTFRIQYLDPKRNLTEKEVAEIRGKLLKNLKEKVGVTVK